MDFSSLIAIFIMVLIYGSAFVVVMYLLIKRIEEKQKEDFEQRDN